MNQIYFHGSEKFSLEYPEHVSYLYFPVAGEQGIKSSITPLLGGDCKLDQNTFVMEPVSAENLHNNRSTRNFWVKVKNKGVWSATGMSAKEEAKRFTDEEDTSKVEAGFMYHSLQRTSKEYNLQATITTFVPLAHNVEIMHVVIRNENTEAITFSPVAAIPVYGRSADNIRDHRHVTSLLHQIKVTENGVQIKPKLSFDERGHKKNDVTYFVYGITGAGQNPVEFYPVVEDFIGDGGNFTMPRSILENRKGVAAGYQIDGKEALGGIAFQEVTLSAGEETAYTIIIGAAIDLSNTEEMLAAYSTKEKVTDALSNMQDYWTEKVNVSFHTGNDTFDQYMRWVCFQPMLRRIYGCSFLPYHDYGKGGRGWRDLWQDCLSLLIMNPDGVRQMIVDNFSGVRMDGTNATIIGTKQGEFIADRNNITRVWMDHGFWPFVTTKFYMDQTGDVEILKEKVPYFKDKQVVRGTKNDTQWNEAYGMRQKNESGEVYYGTILEHLLLQQLCAFYEVGEHNEIRLRGADWNDALDMAEARGESVAFTCAYAGSMQELAEYIDEFARITNDTTVTLPKEMLMLLDGSREKYEDISWKNSVLEKYAASCMHTLSGETVEVSLKELAANLREKSNWMKENIRANEWVTDQKNNGWFNGYYDNNGRQVEGVIDNDIRMMLTGQVFAIMSGTADKEQISQICKSADEYLYEASIGGYRLNTKFSEDKFDLGRMFGFAYGEKENGAVFSHMTVMYAYALYKQGFAKEGFKALQTLIDASMNFEQSKIYPGIPEYFDAKGRGMYHYLTGAASWYMLTLLTKAFGVYGEVGNLVIAPALTQAQFDQSNMASVKLPFRGKTFQIILHNEENLACDVYKVVKAICDTDIELCVENGKAMLWAEKIDALTGDMHQIDVYLG